VILSILPDYFDYIKENPQTLLVRLYGHHEIGGNPFFIMGNVFQWPLRLSCVYDLKGSEVGRTSKSNFVKKDNDVKSNFKIGKEAKKILMKQIENDSGFLRDLNLIDYSLIIGVYETLDGKMPSVLKNHDFKNQCSVFPSTPNNDGSISFIYFFGIIDIFTLYDTYKETEHNLKSLIHNSVNIFLTHQRRKFPQSHQKIILKDFSSLWIKLLNKCLFDFLFHDFIFFKKII
jgi:1-phosphatidylinositol-4-phosphate 5-kinase